MKTFAIIAALAVSATARLSERGDGQKCCFTLTAKGGLSGTVGQLADGQTRIGGGHPPSHFCISNSGGITDQNGRGCILTPPTTQFQCDTGASPTTGFAVNANGVLTHKGSNHFVACKATPNQYNIYTNPNPHDVSGCVDITLHANGCAPTCKPVTVTVTKTVTETVKVCPPPPTTTHPAPTHCPANLNGNYEFPHLIVPIDSAHPNKAAGTSYFGTVSSTISSIFNFDIPASDAGKKCSLVFLFPKKAQLQTSSFTFSGDGKINVAELKGPATQSTTFKNAPAVAKDFGVTTIAPGHSYVIATFNCPANQRIGFEVSNAGTTDFNYFQDYNPAPIGLYITTC